MLSSSFILRSRFLTGAGGRCAGGLLSRHSYSVKADTKLLSKLRKETELSMTQCKEALIVTNNDYAAAILWLDEQLQAIGMKKASKLEGRVMSEGLIGILNEGNTAAMVEVNCETDFVAKNDGFQDLTRQCARAAMSLRGSSPITHIEAEHLKAAAPSGQPIAELIIATVGKLGENLAVRRGATLAVSQGLVGSYLHGALPQNDLGSMGALVGLQTAAKADNLQQLGRQLATHIVGMRPADVPELLSQTFVFDGARTVADVMKDAATSAGSAVDITGFVRYERGEGIEKRQENFAEEVAKQAGH